MKKETKHRLYIKSYGGSSMVINALKVDRLIKYLPSTDVLVAHMNIIKQSMKKGVKPYPFELIVDPKDKVRIAKSLKQKGYTGELSEIPLFATPNNTVPICVLFL